jgi:hypothetical protein
VNPRDGLDDMEKSSILNHVSADDLYATALSLSRLIQRRAEGNRWIMNWEGCGRTRWCPHLPEGTNHVEPQIGYSKSRPRFEPGKARKYDIDNSTSVMSNRMSRNAIKLSLKQITW